MNESIFREKSIQQVQSPDKLNEYIRVSNPGIWILMSGIVFLLLGLGIWGCFGQLRTVVRVEAGCDKGVITCLLSHEDAAVVRSGMTVEIGGREGTVTQVMNGSCTIETSQPLADGVYTAEILVETIHPISFLLNGGE